jgi:tRNA 2-selenouridine synthase
LYLKAVSKHSLCFLTDLFCKYEKFEFIKGRAEQMLKNIDYQSIEKDECCFIDVRSPKEYEESTIPGAVNIPLFDNEERHEIGYVYINESVEKAKKMGIEAVSKKLPQIYDEVHALDKQHKKLVFFCARGGMRSSSLCSLLSTLGINAFRLNGGYKGYRKFINEALPKANEGITYLVLHGKTGVGKTEILKELDSRGYDVLDLEYSANHRGSILGNVGLGAPRSQKAFESIVYGILSERKSDFVFVEAESKRIGDVIIPDFIHRSMVKGCHILIEADLDFRARLLTKEYTKEEQCKEEISDCLNSLGKYISNENISKYKKMVAQGNFEEAAKELMVKYYDPMYLSEIKKYNYKLTVDVETISKSCDIIESWMSNSLGI